MNGSDNMLSFGLPAFGIAFAIAGLLFTWLSARRYDAHFGSRKANFDHPIVHRSFASVFKNKVDAIFISMNAHSEKTELHASDRLISSVMALDRMNAISDGPNYAGDIKHSIYRSRLRFFAKRIIDVFISSLAMFFLFPLLITIAIIIYSADGKPPLFRHMRLGRDGRPFGCLKFRSMVLNSDETLRAHLAANPQARAEWDTTHKLSNDPRITAVGRILRTTSLDELPQLLNVMRGEMSMVGPRPIVRAEVPLYGRAFASSFSVRPGITGLWQISGRTDASYSERVAMDLDYVERWSLRRDIAILLRTIPAFLAQRRSR